jgi:hypothetical protein
MPSRDGEEFDAVRKGVRRVSDLDTLKTAILSLGGPIHAVLDGAQFENLPDTLMLTGLRHRCLFLDRGDNHPDRLVTAPYLVWLGDEEVDGPVQADSSLQRGLERLFSRLATGRSLVFWKTMGGGESLFRHLRGLNRVLVPVNANSDAEPLVGDHRSDDAYEAVLFRHADANALMQVVPSLDPIQLNRLLGPADMLVFMPDALDEAGGGGAPVKRLQRQEGWPAYRPGMLKIEQQQYEVMRHSRLDRSRRRLMSYLRDCAPDETEGLDDDQLYRAVVVAERSGRGLGLRSEAAHGQWAFLMLTTGGQIQEGELVRHAIGRSPDPDRAVTQVLREMIRQSHADAAPPSPGTRRAW